MSFIEKIKHPDKKTLTIIIVASSILIVGAIVAIIIASKRKDDGEGQSAPDPSTNNPHNDPEKEVPATIWPLKLGSVAREVLEIKKAFGLVPNYEYDDALDAKIRNKFGRSQVTKADYDSFVALFKKYGVIN
jgi:hypothetical protein